MIDYKAILDAIQALLENNLDGYTITRNEPRNSDPNIAAKGKGWIGIYRGSLNYEPGRITTGSGRWNATMEPTIEIQTASGRSGADAEAKLQDANPKLSNTVSMTNGYTIDYQYNSEAGELYHLSSIITIHTKTP
jgi:hypothetical protein